jgi:tetratricopeptide (TPR) repeat protein
VLQLAATAGVPAAILVIGLVISVLARAARTAFLRDGQASHVVYAGFWSACVSYVVHLQGSISVPGITVLLWLFLGVLARPLSREFERAPSLRPVAAWVFAGILGVFVLFMVSSSVRADAALLRARNAGDAIARVAALREAHSSAPYVLRYRKDLAKAQQLLASQGPPGSPAARAAYESARFQYLSLISAAPEWPEPYVELVSVYNIGATVTGDAALSAAAFLTAQEALALVPNDPLLRTKAAIAAANSGDSAEALALLNSAVELDLRYSEPWVVRYRVLLATGDTDEARRTAEEMQRRFPEDPAVREALAGN